MTLNDINNKTIHNLAMNTFVTFINKLNIILRAMVTRAQYKIL